MTPTYYTTSGTYYGKGQVRMYNGNGYVKSIDLNDPLPTTPDEAIEYQKNLPESRTILLYESDGTTVIDTFTIVYNIE